MVLMATPQDIEQNWRPVEAETFESETIVTILETADDQLLIEVANYFGIPVVDNNMDELFDDILVAIETSPTSYVTQLEMMLQDETFATETFEANWFSNLFGKPEPKEITAYEMQREIIGDFDYESISTAQRSAGTRLWEACFYACLEEGLSPEKAQQLCNSAFFRKLNPSQVVPYLSQTMRPFVRQYLNYTDREGKSYREAYFEAHEGGHIDEVAHQHSFEAPNRYPVRPTRPSEDWPRPTPRPRRPNRRPNPRPRPARRPF